jgi:hypothetical protein
MLATNTSALEGDSVVGSNGCCDCQLSDEGIVGGATFTMLLCANDSRAEAAASALGWYPSCNEAVEIADISIVLSKGIDAIVSSNSECTGVDAIGSILRS